MNKSILAAALTVCLTLSSNVLAHEHTHIGLNADGITGTAEDITLWIFAEPDNPQWGTINMTPTGDVIGSKTVYEAEIDCWMSAGDLYQLTGADISQKPAWQISLERVGFSSSDFYMELESTGEEILTADGSVLPLAILGESGAWYIHAHTAFLVASDKIGETYTAQFRVIDTGNSGFASSDVYTMTFQTIPEPATLALMGFGTVSLLKRRYRRN